MKKGGGKAKGSSFERFYAKKISLWITDGKRDDAVWRSSNSGGKATVTESDTQCGDLVPTRPEAQSFFDRFSLELKNYKAIDFLHFNKENFILYKWWEQASGDAKRSGDKHPLLIFRINRRGDFLVMNEKTLTELIQTDTLSERELYKRNILTIKRPDNDTLIISDIDLLFTFIDNNS